MNTEQHPHDQQSPEQPPPSEAAGPERRNPSAGVAPEAIQAADVIARGNGYVSRRGLDLNAKLARGTWHGIAVSAKYVGRQLAAGGRRLPPVSAFGRDEPAPEAPGMGRK